MLPVINTRVCFAVALPPSTAPSFFFYSTLGSSDSVCFFLCSVVEGLKSAWKYLPTNHRATSWGGTDSSIWSIGRKGHFDADSHNSATNDTHATATSAVGQESVVEFIPCRFRGQTAPLVDHMLPTHGRPRRLCFADWALGAH